MSKVFILLLIGASLELLMEAPGFHVFFGIKANPPGAKPFVSWIIFVCLYLSFDFYQLYMAMV